jgi:hypothetical protein
MAGISQRFKDKKPPSDERRFLLADKKIPAARQGS